MEYSFYYREKNNSITVRLSGDRSDPELEQVHCLDKAGVDFVLKSGITSNLEAGLALLCAALIRNKEARRA